MASAISPWIILALFAMAVVLILTDKLNRAIVALVAALGSIFTLMVFEPQIGFGRIMEYLFSSEAEGFVNFHSLALILGMTIIVQVCHEAGVFQFIAFNMVKATSGKPVKLLLTMCLLTVLLSAILNNILTVLILIPLTIMISRILNIDPQPYILTQAVLVNIGGTFFSISSIPNILITTSQGISFAEFFLNVGMISFIAMGITLVFFHLIYRSRLESPEAKFVEILKEFNAWNFVQNKPLLMKAIAVLVGTLACFVLIPTEILSTDIIALTGGMILVVISKLKTEVIVSKLNMELTLYLLGIFVISGAMEDVKIIEVIGTGLAFIGGSDTFGQLMVVMWFSTYLSANIDNIPITKVLIPVVPFIGQGGGASHVRALYYGLAIGCNWGDNLTPMGDNVLVMNIASQHKRPITTRQFFVLGFVTTNLQLFSTTLVFAAMMGRFDVLLALLVVLGAFMVVVFFTRKARAGKTTTRPATRPARREGAGKIDPNVKR